MIRYVTVDPATLRTSSQRLFGADLYKLHRQIALYGKSTVGMPTIVVEEDPDGLLGIMDGVTRATRMAKFLPGVTVTVAVIEVTKKSVARRKAIADLLP